MKSFIKNNLFNKRNILDSNKIKKSWFIVNKFHNEYDHILEITNFLSEECSFTERLYCIYNNIDTNSICPVCTTNLLKFNTFTKGYFNYCSTKCSANSKTTRLKFKSTFIERHGSENSFTSKKIMDKAKQTLLDKYGVTSPIHSRHIKQKIENTNIQKYGSKYGFGSDEIKQKICDTNLNKYGSEIHNSNPEVLKYLMDKSWLENQLTKNNTKTISDNLGCSVSFLNKWAREHELFDRIASYSQENEIYEFLNILISNDVILRNIYGIIGNKSRNGRRQLDLYIPERKLAIELNGVYWHKDDKYRHLEKLNLCRKEGIKLLQFWDYQWNDNQDICKSIIKSNLGLNERIYARKCKIIQLNNESYKRFIDNNHLQGFTQSSIKYGLEYNGELVSVIGFSKSRYNKNYDWELIRYANKLNTNVVGGFSKLLKHFRRLHVGSIISYCDLMLFDGKMYRDNGFEFSHESSPGFKYYKNNIIHSRESLQKHKLKNILKDFDPLLTADQNIQNNKFSKFYDCGNGVWVID